MELNSDVELKTVSSNNMEVGEDLEETAADPNESVTIKIQETMKLAQFGSKSCHVNNCKLIKSIYDNIQELIDDPRHMPDKTCSKKRKNPIVKLDEQNLDGQKARAVVESEISEPELEAQDVEETEINADAQDISSVDTSDESDGLQEFLDAVEPKQRKRKPKRKRKLTKEEVEAKEREDLRKRTCDVCSMVFSIPKGLKNHMRSKHTFEKPYSCQLCGERFAIQSTYALHRRRHLGIKPHLCNVCGKTFLRNTDLSIHMRTHNKVRNIQCSLCSNTYYSVRSLKKHVLIKHTDPNEWKHECEICGKKCVSTTTLNLHLKQHNEDRSFRCYFCDKGFFTNQNLQVHIRTHSASTKFNCKLCRNGYRSNEALQRHLVRMHGVGEEKVPSPPKFFCPVCNEGFLQKARLEKHVTMHETGEEEYPFKCESCVKAYKDRHFFTMHMKNKHNLTLNDNYFKKWFSDSSDSCHSVMINGEVFIERAQDNCTEESNDCS